MEKDKGLFSFRKHPVGNFLDGKKGRKRKGGRLRRSMGFLMTAALIFNTLPASGFAVSASEQEKGLCEHHPEHTAECGYAEAQQCTHEHGEECYKTVTECVHEHTDGCYPETGETEESTGEGNATPSDAGNREPSLCTHVCSEESGCITKVLDCHHEHDESCGYQEAQDCGYVCEICNGTEPENTENNAENDTENAGTDTAECICETLCTEDSINEDCPVCGADDAGFLDCKGKVSEENTENQEDTGICKHHQEHDADCGYIPKSEDGEGSPCTYKCRICPIEDLIAALPEQVTEDNAADVRGQLDHILDLYRELTEDEQEEINLSRIYALQGALDAANVPMAAEEIDISQNRNNILTEEDGGCPGHTFTGTTANVAKIYVASGAHNVTFSNLKITVAAAVGVAPGATMNLTIVGTNTIKAGNYAGIYVPKGANLVITAESTGTLEVSSPTHAGIGGAFQDPNDENGDPDCGTVVINGGTITATGGGSNSASAGIGGAGGDDNPGNGGNVTINGGTVTATGGSDSSGNYGGAGIGGGSNNESGNGGTLAINGGHVTLASGQYNPQDGIAYGFGAGSGDVSGGRCELTLADASYLTANSLDPNGKYTIKSAPTADMISVPSDMHYTSADMATEIKGKVTLTGKVTICNQDFTVDTSGWTLDVAKVSDMEYTATYTHADKGTISKTVTILPCIHNNGAALTYHDRVEADCTHTGILEYWDCSICGKKFLDKDGNTEITDTELPIAAHMLTHHDRVEADCTQTGVKEYWDCSVCGKKFSDQNGQPEIAEADIVIPVKTHTLIHHAEVEADCLTEGTIEHWSCSVCNKLFADADGKKKITDIKISAQGHQYGVWESKENGTHTHSCQRAGCDSTETENCSGGTATYTEKAICTVCGGKYGELLKDAGAPTGEISISTNHWNSFLHTITFGLFFKDTEQVTITAQDNESGVASVSYYISDSKLPEEEVKKLDNWTAGNTDKTTFRISPDKSCVVYAKITDKQENVTYISSGGLVFDGTSPSITGIADGETYCTSQEVTVTDNNLESVTVTVNGKEQTLSDGKFTLDVKIDTTPMIIVATDKAGNTATVTVNAGHHYGTEWKSDADEHWRECTACGDKTSNAAHTPDSGTVTARPTTETTGTRVYACTDCREKICEEIIPVIAPGHEHEYSAEWKFNSENHWHECICGETKDMSGHIWDGGTPVTATCTAAGIMTYQCTSCKVTKTEPVDALGHSFTSYIFNNDATCTRDGTETAVCDRCSETMTRTAAGSKKGHTEDSGTVTKQPAENSAGIRTYKCSVCGYMMRTEEIRYKPAGNHGSGGSGGMGSSGGGASTGSPGTGTTHGTVLKQPFIKDSAGREGWDVIRAEAETAAAAPAGGTVAVDMNGAVSVPGIVFEGIRGKNVTVSLDMGNGITWSVNGKDIAADSIKDTDFSVKADAGAVPKELIAETAGGLAHMELSLAHEGTFGFTATLTLQLVSRDGNGITVGSSGTAAGYTGMYANLFYYDPALRSLEFICAGQVGEDGTAALPFVHASDYTVILSAYPMGGTDKPGEPQEPVETEKPQEPLKQAGVKFVKLSKTLYTYNGKPKKPSVIAVDAEGGKISGKYYTVSYKNNKKAGKATAIVKFKGGYSGTVKKTFTIRPAGTSIKKLTAASGGFAVKWKKKTTQTSGYQIQYSTSAGFKGNSTRSVFVKKASVTKQTVKNLKAGKKYYVRIRTYKTVNADGKNTKVYSAWSGAVRVRTLPASGGEKTAYSTWIRDFIAAEREDGRKREA